LSLLPVEPPASGSAAATAPAALPMRRPADSTQTPNAKRECVVVMIILPPAENSSRVLEHIVSLRGPQQSPLRRKIANLLQTATIAGAAEAASRKHSLAARPVGPLEHRTSINADVLTSDVAALLAGEEDAEVGDVFGLDVRDRHGVEVGEGGLGVLAGRLLAFGHHVRPEHAVDAVVLQQMGVDVGGMHSVHPNHLGRHLQAEVIDVVDEHPLAPA